MGKKPTSASFVNELTPRQRNPPRQLDYVRRQNLEQPFRDKRDALNFVATYLSVHDEIGLAGPTCGKLAQIIRDAMDRAD